MIEYVRGKVAELTIDPPTVIIDVSGIGYELRASKTSVDSLTGETREVRMFVWESSGGPYSGTVTLYGFLTKEERTLFLKLKSAKGIGAQDALAVMDKCGARINEMVAIAVSGDVKSLGTQFGFRPQKAEKIVSALKDFSFSQAGGPAPADGDARKISGDAFSALLNMGFREFEARAAVASAAEKLKGGEATLEAFIRESLKGLKK